MKTDDMHAPMGKAEITGFFCATWAIIFGVSGHSWAEWIAGVFVVLAMITWGLDWYSKRLKAKLRAIEKELAREEG